MNVLHLHLSDDLGFRIESDRHPEVVTQPALTKADVRRLVDIANRNHVTLIPEIDMPGHLTAALAQHPELQLRGSDGALEPDKLDITNPAARTFARELIEELVQLFPGPYWHTGGDEYLGAGATPRPYSDFPQLAAFARAKYGPTANGKDAALDFTNFLGDVVRAAGKTQRVWSDGVGGGSAVSLDRRAVVEWWNEMDTPTPGELSAAGHDVLNAGWWPTYYVNGPFSPMADLGQAYDVWQPFRFDGLLSPRWNGGGASSAELDPADPHLTGAEVHVWEDDPSLATENQIAADVAPRLRLIAQKTWGAPPQADTFERIAGSG